MIATLSLPLTAMTPTQTNALILGIISLAFGILILIVPRALNYIVAFYLITAGIVLLVRAFS